MELEITVLRFVLTFLFALIFGLERQRAHKPIGFGTFVFVSIGACGLSLVSEILSPGNPVALLGSIVTGIGFLGAGALIKSTDKIFGFTTAASVWLFAIIGVVIGVGEYFIAIVMYGLVWAVLYIDRILEGRGIGAYQKKLTIVAKREISNDDIVKALGTKPYKILDVDIDKANRRYSIALLVHGTKMDINHIPESLFKADWVESFKIE